MKPKDPIWGFFIQTEGKTTAKCKDCKADISAKAPRLKAHREKCAGLAKQAKKRPIEDVTQDQTPAPITIEDDIETIQTRYGDLCVHEEKNVCYIENVSIKREKKRFF